MNKLVLVIGGAGYIGTHLVEQLLAAGRKVRVLDKLMYGAGPLSDFLLNPNFELIVGDALDARLLRRAVQGASAAVHLAGLVGDEACEVDFDLTRHSNVSLSKHILQACEGAGVERLLFASSCAVYGAPGMELIDEEAAPAPLSLYARTKAEGETQLLSDARSVCVTVLRFATLFGHSRRPRFDLVANLFVAQAIVNGSITVIGPLRRRPLLHVSDAARAIVLSLAAPAGPLRNQIFNAGDDTLNLTLGTIGRTARKIAGGERCVKLTLREDAADRRSYSVSFSKILKALEFRSTVSLEQGLGELAHRLRDGAYLDYRHTSYSNAAVVRHYAGRAG